MLFGGGAELNKFDNDEALADFARALQLDPDLALAYSFRALAEYRESAFDKAIGDASKVVQLKTDDCVVHTVLAWARLRKGDQAGALEEAQKGLDQHGSCPAIAAIDQGFLDFIKGDYTKAVEIWQQVLKEDSSFEHDLRVWIDEAKANQSKAHASP